MMMTARKTFFTLMTMMVPMRRKTITPIKPNPNWKRMRMRMRNPNRSLPLEDREDHVLNKASVTVPQAVETNPIRVMVE